jgi:hypothetical protein
VAVDLQPRTGFHDPLISQVAQTIASQTDCGVLDNILADALSTVLAVRIVKYCVDPSAIALVPSKGLSREQLQRVRDYIEARRQIAAPIRHFSWSRSFRTFEPRRQLATRLVSIRYRTSEPSNLVRASSNPDPGSGSTNSMTSFHSYNP